MTQPKLSSTKLDAPEFLLLMVVTFMLWSVGMVDLLAQASPGPQAEFGPFTRKVFVLLVGHSFIFLVWLAVLVIPRSHLLVFALLRFIQERWWLALPILTIIAAACWVFFNRKGLSELPGLRISLFLLAVLYGAVLALVGWRQRTNSQAWRSLVVIPALVFLVVEGSLQGLAYTGHFPVSAYITDGLFVPYGRIYQNREGLGNGITNNYGWYYPDFSLTGDNKILLLGDTYIQALQIEPEQHLGVQLQTILNSTADSAGLTRYEGADKHEGPPEKEVIALGMPGFGPGLYLSDTRVADMIAVFKPQEVVLFFHLSDDYQVEPVMDAYNLRYRLVENDLPEIRSDQVGDLHDMKHFILPGYNNIPDPIETIRTHLLTRKILTAGSAYAESTADSDAMNMPGTQGFVLDVDRQNDYFNPVQATGLVQTPGASNFMFVSEPDAETQDAAQESMVIATGLIKMTHDRLRDEGITLRLVTIPAFPPAFFAQSDDAQWTSEIGDLDLFLPERALADFAQEQHIPFLAMGDYMLKTDQSIADISSFYYLNGQGHLTPQGHSFFAEAMYSCFYSSADEGTTGEAMTPCFENNDTKE